MDPITLNDSVVAMHELYSSMRVGGFTRLEALYIISCAILQRGPWPPAEAP